MFSFKVNQDHTNTSPPFSVLPKLLQDSVHTLYFDFYQHWWAANYVRSTPTASSIAETAELLHFFQKIEKNQLSFRTNRSVLKHVPAVFGASSFNCVLFMFDFAK